MAFNDPAETSGFDMSDAYRLASGSRPVRAKDLRAAYRPYTNTGRLKLKVGYASAGKKSDEKLYQRAVTEVMEWWNARKAQPKGKGKAKASGPRPGNTGGRPRKQAGQAGGAARSGPGRPRNPGNPSRARVVRGRMDIQPVRNHPNAKAPTTRVSGVRIQRPAGRGFTPYGL